MALVPAALGFVFETTLLSCCTRCVLCLLLLPLPLRLLPYPSAVWNESLIFRVGNVLLLLLLHGWTELGSIQPTFFKLFLFFLVFAPFSSRPIVTIENSLCFPELKTTCSRR